MIERVRRGGWLIVFQLSAKLKSTTTPFVGRHLPVAVSTPPISRPSRPSSPRPRQSLAHPRAAIAPRPRRRRVPPTPDAIVSAPAAPCPCFRSPPRLEP